MSRYTKSISVFINLNRFFIAMWGESVVDDFVSFHFVGNVV